MKLKRILDNFSKDETIQRQADTINYLIEEMNLYKSRCLKHQKEKKELKTKLNYLIERDNKLQEIEMMFKNKEIDLKKLSKIVKRGEK